jgi:hypothetical protein
MVYGNGDDRVQLCVSLRNWIETAFGEGMAAGEATEGQPRTFDDAEADEGDVGVLRTCWKIEAFRRAEGVEGWGEHGLVEPVGGPNGGGGLRFGVGVRRHGAAW